MNTMINSSVLLERNRGNDVLPYNPNELGPATVAEQSDGLYLAFVDLKDVTDGHPDKDGYRRCDAECMRNMLPYGIPDREEWGKRYKRRDPDASGTSSSQRLQDPDKK